MGTQALQVENGQPPGDPQVLRSLVRNSPLPVWLLGLEDRQILEVSDSMALLLGGSRDRLLQADVTDFLVAAARSRSRLAMLASGELEGYRLLQTPFRRLNGTEFVLDGFVTAVTGDVPRRFAVGVFLRSDSTPLFEELSGTAEKPDVVVLGTADGNWRVDRISADIEQLLGYQAPELIGGLVSTLVHVDDLPYLLIALGQGQQQVGGATVCLRFRDASGEWRLCRALIAPLAGQSAPELGFAFALADATTANGADRTRELEGHLRRIAREVVATGVLSGLLGTPAATALPAMGDLSWRQMEIVTSLVAGERVPMIARRLFLSESTVRNHLTSVYRKLGVNSQQELLATLRSTPAQDAREVHAALR